MEGEQVPRSLLLLAEPLQESLPQAFGPLCCHWRPQGPRCGGREPRAHYLLPDRAQRARRGRRSRPTR